MFIVSQVIIHNYYPAKESNHTNFYLTYLPVLSFGFLILSFIIDRYIANRSKNKQIIREWYNKALLEPCLLNCNVFFIDVKELTTKHLASFDEKRKTLTEKDFLRYKGQINDHFERIKITFYNENLLPIYQNYPTIAENCNKVLLRIQDQFIELFGGDTVDSDVYYDFMNNLYSEKGLLLAILEAPLSSRGKAKLKLTKDEA